MSGRDDLPAWARERMQELEVTGEEPAVARVLKRVGAGLVFVAEVAPPTRGTVGLALSVIKALSRGATRVGPMGKYRKLIAAVIGLFVLLAKDFLGWNLDVNVDQLVNLTISILTAFGVFRLPNDPD